MTLVDDLALGFAALVLLLSIIGLLAGMRNARRSVAPAGDWRPFATVVMPCRGLHQGLEENALAIAGQDYPDFEVLFVVDDLQDPAAPVLQRVAKKMPRARVILSEPESVGKDWSSGKMVAQRTGALRASPRSEVLVFADADARPSRSWLACLVSPLKDAKVGVATGYRWYTAATKLTFASVFRDSWDHIGVDAVSGSAPRVVWGGSMAMRKADFWRPELAEAWRKSIADDVATAQTFQKLGSKLHFAPGALAVCAEDTTWDEMVAFLARECAMLRQTDRKLYGVAVALYVYQVLCQVLGLALVVTRPSPTLALAGVALLVPTLLSILRAALRERLVLRALPDVAKRPLGERLGHMLLTAFVPIFTMPLFLRVRRMQGFEWRGRKYTVGSGSE